MMLPFLEDAVWHRLATRCGANNVELTMGINGQHGGIHKLADASEHTLTRLFSALDVEDTGFIRQQELQACMERIIQGFGGKTLDPESFGIIWGAIHEDNKISSSIFEWVVRRLKLELLLTLVDVPPARQPGEAEHLVFKNKLYEEDIVLKSFAFTRHETFSTVVTQGKLREFYLAKPKANVVLKWIVVDSRDTIDLLRLGAKYGLHPLHVNDCLRLEKQKAKSVSHKDSTFITMPILRLTKQSRKALNMFQEKMQEEDFGPGGEFGGREGGGGKVGWGGGSSGRKGTDADGVRIEEPFQIVMEQATVGIFIAANDTVITVRTPWKVLRGKGSAAVGGGSTASATGGRDAVGSTLLKTLRLGGKAGRRRRTSQQWVSSKVMGSSNKAATGAGPQAGLDGAGTKRKKAGGGGGGGEPQQMESALESFFDIDIDEEEGGEGEGGTADDEEDTEMLTTVSETVHHSNITITGNTPHWLLHGVIDHLVDRLIPIVDAYQTSLHWYQEVLHEDEARFGKVRAKKLMKMTSDLQWLQRKVLLLKPVVKSILRKVEGDLQLYYQDIDDHLERCSENIGALVTLCEGCMSYVHSNREAKANQVLLVITVITTVFAPASFLAGVYGMNFATRDGVPTIPELNWKYGYVYFWVWTVVLMVAIMGFLRYRLHFSLYRALK